MLWDFVSRELVIAAIAWLTAQLIKCVINLVVNRSFSLSVALGSGGMPSSHTSTVCALCAALAVYHGTRSSVFGLACILAFVVMYDAIGVRRETGKQGKAINSMMQIFEDMGKPLPLDIKFKELVGHSPLQVLAGAVLGICEGVFFAELFK